MATIKLALRPTISGPSVLAPSASVRKFTTGSNPARDEERTVSRKSQSGKFTRAKKAHVVARAESGGQKLDHPMFRNIHGRTNLPEIHQVPMGPLALNSAIAFGSEKGSLIKNFGVPKIIEKEITHLSQPFAVVRDISLSTFKKMDQAGSESSSQNRMVLTGPRGCGKSMTLLQVADYCASRDWIILYEPRAIDWVNSSSPYIYDSRTRTFLQPALAAETLKRIVSFNKRALSTILSLEEIQLDKGGQIPKGTDLEKVAGYGIQDPTLAPHVLGQLLQQLEKQTQYPVLLAIDDFQALYKQSLYRDPLYHFIKSYHLSMPRLMLEYASGRKTFARGAVVGAISTTNSSFLPPIELNETLQLIDPKRPSNIFAKRNPDLVEYARGLQNLAVPEKFNIHEAATFFEVWAHSETLHTFPTESAFLAKLTESSSNPREFLHRGFLSTLASM